MKVEFLKHLVELDIHLNLFAAIGRSVISVNNRQERPENVTMTNIQDERLSSVIIPTEGSVIVYEEFELNQSKTSRIESVVSDNDLLRSPATEARIEKVKEDQLDPILDLEDGLSAEIESVVAPPSDKDTRSEGQLSVPIESKSEENSASRRNQSDSEHEEEESPMLLPPETVVCRTRSFSGRWFHVFQSSSF